MIDYAFFRALPIADVCRSLGIEVNRNGRFICPAHDDTSPSACINPKNDTRWTCFACGAKGSALDLVADYNNCSISKAAYTLDELGFKGGIREEKGIAKEAFAPPEISFADLKRIGLKHNPFSESIVRTTMPDSKAPGRQIVTTTVFSIVPPENAPDYIEGLITASGLIIDKITEHERAVNKYTDGVLKNFPNLDINAINTINQTTADTIKYFDELANNFREYNRFLCQVLEAEGLNPPLDFDMELSE